MRRALLFLFGMLFGVCVAHTPAAATPSQGSDHVAGAKALESKTVAILDINDNGAYASCSGVWVSPTTILTALHCIGGETVVAYIVREDVLPKGSDREVDEFVPRIALTYAIDLVHDLALLRAQGKAPAHGIAHTRRGTVEQGMFTQAMGMPLGRYFTYATGFVSAVRVIDFGAGDTTYVQTTAPTSAGCSGSGLFDVYGDLIGVAHAVSPLGQAINFYVHKSHVDDLLRAQGKAL